MKVSVLSSEKKKKKRFIFSFKGFSKGQQAVGCGRRCIYGIIKKKERNMLLRWVVCPKGSIYSSSG